MRRYPDLRGRRAPVVNRIADEVLEQLEELRLVPGNDGEPGGRDTGTAFADRRPEVGDGGLDYGGAIHGRKGPRLRGQPGVRQEVFDQALHAVRSLPDVGEKLAAVDVEPVPVLFLQYLGESRDGEQGGLQVVGRRMGKPL